jgi:uncharacterized membrane protein YbhN (UPF0104 family)
LKKNLGTAIKVLLSLGLGIGLIWWYVAKMTPEQKTETMDAFRRADYFWVLMAPCIGLVSNFLRTQRWRLMLRPLGFNPGFWNTFFSVMIMYFFNLFVPRLGEVTRCTILAQYEDVPVEKSIGTMITERLIDVICLFSVGGILFVMERDRLMAMFQTIFAEKESGGDSSHFLKYVLLGAIALAVAAAVVYVYRKYGVQKLKETIIEKTRGFMQALISVKDIEEKGQFIAITIVMWLSYLMMFFVIYKAFPETSGLPIMSAVACLFFGSFAVVATPGGIGVFPILIQGILVLYNVSPSMGAAVGTLSWGIQTLGVLIGGFSSLILLNLLNKNSKIKTDAA